MVLTTLLLRLRTINASTRREPLLFRLIGLGLLLLCLPLFTACGPGGDTSGDPSMSAGMSTVSLQWDPVQEPNLKGYFVYYGTRSANSPGSCAYAARIFTHSAMATVHGLAPDTQYFFAVSAFNGLESPCSAEVSTITQSV